MTAPHVHAAQPLTNPVHNSGTRSPGPANGGRSLPPARNRCGDRLEELLANCSVFVPAGYSSPRPVGHTCGVSITGHGEPTISR